MHMYTYGEFIQNVQYIHLVPCRSPHNQTYGMKLTDDKAKLPVFSLPQITIFLGDSNWKHHLISPTTRWAAGCNRKSMCWRYDCPTDRIAGSPVPLHLRGCFVSDMWGSGFEMSRSNHTDSKRRRGTRLGVDDRADTSQRDVLGTYRYMYPGCSTREPLPRARLGRFEPHPSLTVANVFTIKIPVRPP
jgi:hypothetical protein